MPLKRLRLNGDMSTQLGERGDTDGFREDSFSRVTEMEAWHCSTPECMGDKAETAGKNCFFQKPVKKRVTAKTKGPEFFNKIQLCLWDKEFEHYGKGRINKFSKEVDFKKEM